MSAEDRGTHPTRQERARRSHMEWKNDAYKQARGAARPVARIFSINKRMGLGSSNGCIWTEFTSHTSTKDCSIVPSRISRTSSVSNAGSISGFR